MSSQSSEVLIVGAGIVGLCAAHELSERGVKVLVVDRERPADGASCGNAGLISYGHPPLTRPGVSWRGLRWMFDRTSPLLVRPRLKGDFLRWMWTFHRHCTRSHFDRCMDVLALLGRASLERFDAIAEAAGDCGYRAEGWLDVFATSQAMQASGSEASILDRLGYPSEPWDGAALRRREPAYRDELAGARHYALAATLDPRRLVSGLVRHLESRGVEFRFGGEVESLL
ncbi:MAG: FAD-dependent oxidoreductase, partial [Phycisphaerales bacterium]